MMSLSVLACVATARADISTSWKGNSGSWTDSTQWSGEVVPVNNSPTGALYDVTMPAGIATLPNNYTDTVQSLNISNCNISGASATITAVSGFTFGGSNSSNHAIVNVGVLNSPPGAISTLNPSADVLVSYDNSETFLNGGTFNMVSGALYLYAFNNSGAIVVNAGSNAVQLEATFVNGPGSLNIQSGTLQLSGGIGNWTRQLVPTLAPGATLDMINSTALLGFNSPTGNLSIDNCSIFINNNRSYGAATTQISNGNLNINSPNASTSVFTLNNASTFEMTGTSGQFVVTGSLNCNGIANLSGGAVCFNGSNFSCNGDLYLQNTASLINNSTMNISAGSLFLQTGGALINNGTMNLGAGSFNGSGGVFTNNGSFTVNPGAVGLFSLTQNFINTGTVYVRSGTLAVSEPFTSAGTYNLSSGASLVYMQSAYRPISLVGQGTATFNGNGGTFYNVTLGFVSGVSLVFNESVIGTSNQSNASVSGLTIVDGSELSGTASFNVSGPVVLNGAYLYGVTVLANKGITFGSGTCQITGTLVNVAGQTAACSGATTGGYIDVDSGGLFVNAGTYNAGAVGVGGGGGTLLNSGTINFNSSASIISETFNNSGTVNYNAPAGSPEIENTSLINTGAFNVLAGSLFIDPTGYGASNTFSGSISIAAGATASFFLGTRQQLAASVSGAGSLIIYGGGGVIAPTAYNFSGTVTVNYTQTIAAGNNFGSTGSVVVRGNVILDAGNTGAISSKYFSSLSIIASDSLIVQSSNASSSRTLLSLGSLILSGTIDLGNNDMVVTGGSLSSLTSAITSGYANGAWNGSGLISSAAMGNTSHLTSLGVIQNNQSGTALYTASNLFDGMTPGAGDILIKYTYYGDTNLDGKVDGSDYSRIDSAFLADRTNPTAQTGWFNGDFNYDGVVNGSDYTLIDNAFNTQGAQLSAATAAPTAQLAGSVGNAVPEPAGLSLLALGAMKLLGRRSYRRDGPRFTKQPSSQ